MKIKLHGVVNKNAMTLFNENDIGSNVLRLANLWPTNMRSNWNLKIAFLWYFIYLLLAEFEVHTVSYGPSFFRSIYGPSAKHAGHKPGGKTTFRNLQYGPTIRD